mmetsp:Transcript_95172/g.289008  ORF Transcript_95172/g.289008 Transcript_95172/m.289008 type:complete len:242 (+) Transcript_95172:578-1303(+)
MADHGQPPMQVQLIHRQHDELVAQQTMQRARPSPHILPPLLTALGTRGREALEEQRACDVECRPHLRRSHGTHCKPQEEVQDRVVQELAVVQERHVPWCEHNAVQPEHSLLGCNSRGPRQPPPQGSNDCAACASVRHDLQLGHQQAHRTSGCWVCGLHREQGGKAEHDVLPQGVQALHAGDRHTNDALGISGGHRGAPGPEFQSGRVLAGPSLRAPRMPPLLSSFSVCGQDLDGACNRDLP